jgi:hypothetical protein
MPCCNTHTPENSSPLDHDWAVSVSLVGIHASVVEVSGFLFCLQESTGIVSSFQSRMVSRNRMDSWLISLAMGV